MEKTGSEMEPLMKNKRKINHLIDPCLICGVPTPKLHLQVNACYACAAFYRRSQAVYANYKCQKINKSCDLTVKTIGKPLCRLCRYNKCVEIGMIITIEKSQDIPGITTTDNEPTDLLSMNFDEIFDLIKKIFKEAPTTSNNFQGNHTEQFIETLKIFLEDFKPKKDLICCTDYGNIEKLEFVMKHFVETAKMLCKYPPFASLQLEDKLQLHGQFWQSFRQCERLYQTQQHFGNGINDYRIAVDHSHFIDFAGNKYDIENPNYNFFETFVKRCMRFTDMFKRTKITLFEFAYISQIILWSNFSFPLLNESTQKYAEKIVKEISDELDNYYVNDLRLATYAARQAQLLRLITFTNIIKTDEEYSFEKKKVNHHLFNQLTYILDLLTLQSFKWPLSFKKKMLSRLRLFTSKCRFAPVDIPYESRGPAVIGIDFGTTNSCVAVLKNSYPKIVDRIPSVVAFTKYNQRIVGTEVKKRHAIISPSNTLYATKRLIGRKYDDEEVQKAMKIVPYKIVKAKNADAWIEAQENVYSPTQIAAYLIRNLKESAEIYLGANVVECAVLTAPAYFNDTQKQAIKDAGKIAGLKVLRVLIEPIAAALAYGLDKADDKIIAVYDLDGATFNISILENQRGIIQILSTNGDMFLDAKGFDNRLMQYLFESFKNEKQKDVVDLTKDPMVAQLFYEMIEKENVKIPDLSTFHIHGGKVTRKQYEKLIDDLLKHTIEPCQKALRDANIKVSDIQDVLLVGGMSRMPQVQKLVQQMFECRENNFHDPEGAVAIGAVKDASFLVGDEPDVIC